MDVNVQRLKQKNENIPVPFQEMIVLPLPWGVFLIALKAAISEIKRVYAT